MLAGDRFLRCGGSAGKPGRNNAGNQKADRQYTAAGTETAATTAVAGYCQHRCDGYRHQSTHQHVGQFVDVRADACCQVPAVQPDGGLEGTTLAVTVEPCTMCAGALVLARVARLVFGAWEPKTGAVGSLWDVVRDRRLNHRPEVRCGVLARECAAPLEAFFARQRLG